MVVLNWLYSIVRACHLGKLLSGGGDVPCCWSSPSLHGGDGSCIFHPPVSVSVAYCWLEGIVRSTTVLSNSNVTLSSGSWCMSPPWLSTVRGDSSSLESSVDGLEYSRFAMSISCPCHIFSMAMKPSPHLGMQVVCGAYSWLGLHVPPSAPTERGCQYCCKHSRTGSPVIHQGFHRAPMHDW